MPTYSQLPFTPLVSPRVIRTAGLSTVSDVVLRSVTKTISGHVYNSSGAAVVGATVLLFRQSDNLYCGMTTSIAAGIYSFPRDATDTNTYYTISYSVVNGNTQIHGTSDRGLVPA